VLLRRFCRVCLFAFCEEDLHSILDGNGVDGSECFLDLLK
jgi:hypothetical protein